MRKLIAKNDIILALIMLLIALVIWFSFSLRSNETVTAVIEVSGEIVKEISLRDISEEISFSVNGKNGIDVEIIAKNGKICFEDSHCADLICVRTGWLSRAGQTAVCLPAKVSIYIKGGEKAVDAVTQ